MTHDGRLIERVADQIWIMNHKERRIDKWDGSFAEYRQKLIDEQFASDYFEDGSVLSGGVFVCHLATAHCYCDFVYISLCVCFYLMLQ